MNKPLSKLFLLAVLLGLGVNGWSGSEAHDNEDSHEQHEDHEEHNEQDQHGEHEEAGVVELSAAQQRAASIVVQTLEPRQLAAEIRAPGEVMLNAYRSSKVTPRVTAQIIERHVTLGDRVTPGQKLVTLSSVEMAEAQGALLVADREWQRVKKLGVKVASQRRYTEAQVNRQLAWAKVSAYGMTPKEINALLKSGNARKANGEFNLLAARDGTVIEDNFIEGAVVSPGDVLMTITDESAVWVEARLTPAQLVQISKGARASVLTPNGELVGKVTQIHHIVDEASRTIAVRISVDNPEDRIHPGEFVDVMLQTNTQEMALAVPDTALVRGTDGDWQLFIAEHDGEFRAVEVDLLGTRNGYTRISGLEPGVRIVTEGAFFLQSELAKSGFDVHNH